MHFIVRNKLKEDEKYLKYLRDNSYYYKILNRDPNKINDMINEMKEKYGLRFTDKLDNISNVIDILSLLNEK